MFTPKTVKNLISIQSVPEWLRKPEYLVKTKNLHYANCQTSNTWFLLMEFSRKLVFYPRPSQDTYTYIEGQSWTGEETGVPRENQKIFTKIPVKVLTRGSFKRVEQSKGFYAIPCQESFTFMKAVSPERLKKPEYLENTKLQFFIKRTKRNLVLLIKSSRVTEIYPTLVIKPYNYIETVSPERLRKPQYLSIFWQLFDHEVSISKPLSSQVRLHFTFRQLSVKLLTGMYCIYIYIYN